MWKASWATPYRSSVPTGHAARATHVCAQDEPSASRRALHGTKSKPLVATAPAGHASTQGLAQDPQGSLVVWDDDDPADEVGPSP
jgi:hypothetical protein